MRRGCESHIFYVSISCYATHICDGKLFGCVNRISDERLCGHAMRILHVRQPVYVNCIFGESKSYRATTNDNENLIDNVSHNGSEKIVSHANLYDNEKIACHEIPNDYATRHECGRELSTSDCVNWSQIYDEMRKFGYCAVE